MGPAQDLRKFSFYLNGDGRRTNKGGRMTEENP